MPYELRMARAALGFRPHTGWAAAVGIVEGPDVPRVVLRRRLELFGASAHVYHRAAEQRATARALVDDASTEVRLRADAAVAECAAELERAGHAVAGATVIRSSAKLPAALDAILASHPLIHSAEGELFAGALDDACRARKLPVGSVAHRNLSARAAAALGLGEEELRRRVTAAGRAVGKPWAQDQKAAMLAAWPALLA